jgi:general secretion pathway protein G
MSRLFKLFLLVLLAVLVACIIPALQGSHPGKVQATMSEIAALSNAISAFQVDCRRFPTTTEGLLALVVPPSAMLRTNLWHGSYLDQIPKDPWGNPYIYECPGLHNTNAYDVYSLGPEGKGGNEAIGNWISTR